MAFLVGMLAGMLLLWAIRAGYQQCRLDGWDRMRGDARHVRRFYESIEKQRGGQG